MATAIRDGETMVFTGDSITDCGRRTVPTAPHGNGYVCFFRDFMTVREPAKTIQLVNTGIGGDTIAGLRDRWMDDVIAFRPDWLSVKIGINDCHRFLSDPQGNAIHGPEGYAKNYDEVLKVTKRLLPNVQLLLIDPFYCSADLDDELPETHRARAHKLLLDYLAVVDELGRRYGARRVKTHELFARQFEQQPRSLYFPHEPVHPNQAGHILIAEAVYHALSD